MAPRASGVSYAQAPSPEPMPAAVLHAALIKPTQGVVWRRTPHRLPPPRPLPWTVWRAPRPKLRLFVTTSSVAFIFVLSMIL